MVITKDRFAFMKSKKCKQSLLIIIGMMMMIPIVSATCVPRPNDWLGGILWDIAIRLKFYTCTLPSDAVQIIMEESNTCYSHPCNYDYCAYDYEESCSYSLFDPYYGCYYQQGESIPADSFLCDNYPTIKRCVMGYDVVCDLQCPDSCYYSAGVWYRMLDGYPDTTCSNCIFDTLIECEPYQTCDWNTGQCEDICSPGWTDEYDCLNAAVTRKKINNDCTETWVIWEDCYAQGKICENGECVYPTTTTTPVPTTTQPTVTTTQPVTTTTVPTECLTDNDCEWCGSSCVRKGSQFICISIAQSGYDCRCVNNVCTAIPIVTTTTTTTPGETTTTTIPPTTTTTTVPIDVCAIEGTKRCRDERYWDVCDYDGTATLDWRDGGDCGADGLCIPNTNDITCIPKDPEEPSCLEIEGTINQCPSTDVGTKQCFDGYLTECKDYPTYDYPYCWTILEDCEFGCRTGACLPEEPIVVALPDEEDRTWLWLVLGLVVFIIILKY